MVEIIAEIGLNHNGSMKLAKELIRLAKEGGADVAKFQLYATDEIFTPDFEWYKIVKHCELSKDNIRYLMDECDNHRIEFLTSLTNTKHVDMIEELGIKRYKIPSRCDYNREVIDAVAATGKDIIISLGFWKEPQFPIIKTKGKVNYLYCISNYPTNPKDIDWEEMNFDKYSGFSDHTIGIDTSIRAIDMGAKIIEKHFTLDKKMYGPDHSGSMEPHELKLLTTYIKEKHDNRKRNETND